MALTNPEEHLEVGLITWVNGGKYYVQHADGGNIYWTYHPELIEDCLALRRAIWTLEPAGAV